MSDSSEDLFIECEEEAGASSLNSELTSFDGTFSRIVKKENLVGGGAEWVVVATLAIKMLPQILDALGRFVEKWRVRSIKIGNIEIRNPSVSDIRDIRHRLHKDA
jgi:hypothetical protein